MKEGERGGGGEGEGEGEVLTCSGCARKDANCLESSLW